MGDPRDQEVHMLLLRFRALRPSGLEWMLNLPDTAAYMRALEAENAALKLTLATPCRCCEQSCVSGCRCMPVGALEKAQSEVRLQRSAAAELAPEGPVI